MCEQGSRYLSWDIIPSCVTFGDLRFQNIVFVLQLFFVMQMFLVFYILGLDFCVVVVESIFWFECGVPFKIFCYYVL